MRAFYPEIGAARCDHNHGSINQDACGTRDSERRLASPAPARAPSGTHRMDRVRLLKQREQVLGMCGGEVEPMYWIAAGKQRRN